MSQGHHGKLFLALIFCLSSVGRCTQFYNKTSPLTVDDNPSSNVDVGFKQNFFSYLAYSTTEDSSKASLGYIGAAVAVLFFGSNFVPVKKIETGDGMFFQWILCSAIWVTGIITNIALDSPPFYPFALVGGCLWATGNICVVPIIKTIGLALGMLIWGAFNMLSGWATGRFGLFKTEKDKISDTTMNTISIVLAMMAGVCWMFVKSETNSINQEPDDDDDALLAAEQELESIDEPDRSWLDSLTLTQKRTVGIVLSAISGLFYGFSFVPVLYIKNNYDNAPQADIDYVFAHYCGIFLTSTLYFTLYCCVMKNRPKLYTCAVLPGMISGVMWGVAEIGWFIANRYLEPAISFPIITSGPALIASLWGVLVFKEVRGVKNFAIMTVAYSFTIAAVILAAISKSG